MAKAIGGRTEPCERMRDLLREHGRRIAVWDEGTDGRYSHVEMFATPKGCIILHSVTDGRGKVESWDVYRPVSPENDTAATFDAVQAFLTE